MRDVAPKGMAVPAALEAGFTLIACGSHRAREKLIGRDDSSAQSYYSWDRAPKGGIYAVRATHEALPTGCTRLRAPFADLGMCWG